MRLSVGSSDRWDRTLFGSTAALAALSALTMMSAGATISPTLAPRHALWIVLGVIVSLLVTRTNYRRWTDLAGFAYGASLLALLLVPVAGAMRLGATRWLSIFGLSVQPSELAKLTAVWLLARYLAGQPAPLPGRVLWTSLLLVGPPALLIFLQPDLGSASIFGAIWFGMVWAAGISRRALIGLSVSGLAILPLTWHVLKGYQRDRLLAFIDPHADPLGTGYTIIQSTIAIGSGRLFGRGWFAGTQNQLSFLPERHSDFIFSVIGEEWGFVGCLAVVALFSLLLLRVGQIALSTSDPQGRLLTCGVFSWIGYQAFVNMGMVMGLLPVVGVPLPLVSYGGSSMVALWIALGLVQSVRRMS
ncbi:MAG: rod shape-determining protein RodA [Candidatus Omnitrophica bacterium]|nr:rod shape-determining protein RodA [Candidatus Omnitrophota bacterium]